MISMPSNTSGYRTRCNAIAVGNYTQMTVIS